MVGTYTEEIMHNVIGFDSGVYSREIISMILVCQMPGLVDHRIHSGHMHMPLSLSPIIRPDITFCLSVQP